MSTTSTEENGRLARDTFTRSWNRDGLDTAVLGCDYRSLTHILVEQQDAGELQFKLT